MNPDSHNFDPHEVWIFMKSNPLEAWISCESISGSYGFHGAHAFGGMDFMKSELLGTRISLNPELRRVWIYEIHASRRMDLMKFMLPEAQIS